MKSSSIMPDGSLLGQSGAYCDLEDGARIYYEIHGRGDYLVLMHGGLEPMESLYGMADLLSRSFTVIIPEQRGHGRTPDTPGPYRYEQFSRDTVFLMESLGIPSAHLAGFSDGAITALFMGLFFPERVTTITSIGGNYHYTGLSRKFAIMIESLTAESFAAKNRRSVDIYRNVSPDGPDHFPVVFNKVKHLWLTQPRLIRQNLKKIGMPSLIMAGDRDLVSLHHTTNMFRALPAGACAIVPQTTHMLPVERPQEVCRILIEFIGKTTKTASPTTP